MLATRCLLVIGAFVLAVPTAAGWADRSEPPLVVRVSALAPAVDRAARAARSGSPDAVQSLYDAARDLEEAVLTVPRVSTSCRRLKDSALGYARAHIMQAEGFDLLRPDIADTGRRRAAAAKRRLDDDMVRCEDDAFPGESVDASTGPLLAPATGQVVFGDAGIESLVPTGARWATIAVDGNGTGCAAAVRRRYEIAAKTRFEVDLALSSGRHDVAVSFCAQERGSLARLIATRTAERVWVLPPSARVAAPTQRANRGLSDRLKSVAASFDGYSAVWFHDLRTGRTAAWNAEVRFPAASTVKLGVLVAALRVLGKRPERGRFAYDLETMTGWSSNLATNRLLRRIGRGSIDAGSRAADRALKELGASSSTFTGEYRVGTSAARPNAEPPLVSSRVTTARDLGRLFFQIHSGAVGRQPALRALKLEERRAQLALGLLLSSAPLADNVGLVRGSVPPAVPIAQKHGWLRDARHTGAIAYYPRGPELIVVLTYRPGLTLGAASAFAGEVMEIVRRARNT